MSGRTLLKVLMSTREAFHLAGSLVQAILAFTYRLLVSSVPLSHGLKGIKQRPLMNFPAQPLAEHFYSIHNKRFENKYLSHILVAALDNYIN